MFDASGTAGKGHGAQCQRILAHQAQPTHFLFVNPYKAATRPAPAPLKAPARAFLGMKGFSVHQGVRERGKKGRPLDPRTNKKRFKIQRVTRNLLRGERIVTRNGKERDRWAVVGCNMNMLGDVVGIYRAVDGGDARYAGVVTCGSVWTCPVCAGRIAEERRLEIQLAIRKHVAQAGAVYLMTLTAPHTRELPLETFLTLFRDALKRFKNCKTYKRISTRYARVGSVRSLEVTWGENGWHPHTHDLVFAGPGLLDDYHAIEELRQEWVRICIKVELGDNSKRNDMLAHGFDLRGGDYAADYVAKFGRQPELDEWGISDELTRSHSKTGSRAGHMTPFALLIACERGDAHAGELFVKYAHAFEHERMLYWSPKLKARFGINEATDEDLARAPLPREERIAELDGDQWRLVVSREARGELLFWAATEGERGVMFFLEELATRPRTHGHQLETGTMRR